MRRGDAADPLLRQVLPMGQELETREGFGLDPLRELASSPALGLIHKYQGRALLVLTGACAVHCRYCFRRHFPYAEHALGDQQAEEVLVRLRQETSLREVILSGGDPLALSDQKLADWVRALGEIPHLERLRIHTRLPIVLPERVDDDLLAWLAETRLRTVVVLHANHGQEIDHTVRRAVRDLNDTGAAVLNQAVLLAGVNDSVTAQVALSEALFSAGVLPYYLHLLDRVAGAHHFDVPEERAREIFRGVTQALPGYLVPRWVRDVPGSIAKVPLELGGASAYRSEI